MAAPQFIEADLDLIINETIQDYQTKTGKILVPTDVEYLLLQSGAYREFLLRLSIQSAAEQNLVDFATGGVLEYLAALVGVVRLSSAPASCVLGFTVTGPHAALIIPGGTRVQSADGQVVFQTLQDYSIAANLGGAIVYEVEAECQTAGTVGNGYIPAAVNNLIDAFAFVNLVVNLNTTAGGSDSETDESLRQRVKLAPSAFSTAGSFDAYKFHALSASTLISDVSILGPPQSAPGTVEIYPLMSDGSTTPIQVINAVEAACNDEKVSPLTDTIIVQSPTRLDYTITVELIAFLNADLTEIITQVTANLNAFAEAKRKELGQDITESQVIAQCQISGVYSVSLPAWSDIIVDSTEFPFCTAINVSITATTTG
jgi:phage-related baseplate assembly protein